MVFIVELTKNVNGINFGADRKDIRKAFGGKYKELKKSFLANNTMDAYKDFHIYYDNNNCFEAIEIFDGNELRIEGKRVFPGGVSELKRIIGDLSQEEYGGYISVNKSVGVTMSTDKPEEMESILIGCKNYYG